MSDDLIYRQAAIEAVRHSPIIEVQPAYMLIDKGDALKNIVMLPSAQPERKRGKWINAYPDIEPNPMFMYGICSVCGYEQAIYDMLKFCPNCGADMREVE